MPIHESLKAIVEEARFELDEMKKRCEQREERASRVIDDAMGKMEGLVQFAEGLPQKMLDRFSTVLIGEFDQSRFGVQGKMSFCELRMNNCSIHLSGIMGRELDLKGRYRIVTILEKID
jgi:hypothetical protein